MLEATIEELIGSVIAAAAGVPVVWGEQEVGAPRPGIAITWLVPFIPTGDQPEEHPHVGVGIPDGTWISVEHGTATLQLDCYGASTRGDASSHALGLKVRSGLALDAARAALAAQGLAVVGRGPVRNAAAVIGVTMAGRALLELTLGRAVAETQDRSWIESAVIEDGLTY